LDKAQQGRTSICIAHRLSTIQINNQHRWVIFNQSSGKALKFSIKRYGKENHRVEILEMVENRELLGEREKAIVTLNKVRDGKCMNLKIGGIGGFMKKDRKKKKKKKSPVKKRQTKPKK
jgi:hypothetical protein